MYKLVLNVFLLLFFLLMLFSLLKVVSGKAQEENNLKGLKLLVSTRNKENTQLKSEYYYDTSEEYIQKIAREQLGMASKNEFIVTFSTNSDTQTSLLGKSNSTLQKQIASLLNKN